MLLILLTFIFFRPFISSLAFPYFNFAYSILFLAIIILWLIINHPSIEKLKNVKLPLCLFILALAIQFLFSSNKLFSLIESYKYITGLLIFLIALNLTAQEKDSLIRTMVLSAIAVSILAIYQYFFGFTHILEYLNKGNTGNLFLLDTIGQKRVFLPFASPNMLAGYLIMVIPLCLLDKKRRIYILPLCIGLVLTKSLGAIISLFMVLIIYGVLRFKSNKKIVAFAAIGVLTILLIVFLRNCSQRWHFTPGFSVMMRWGYWQDTWAVIKNNIFTGVGIGNFDLPDSRFAHNSYLQIWAEMGIPGILAFIYLILGISRSAIRKLTRLGLDYKYMAIFLAWSVFLLHNSVDFTFFLPEVSFVWWLLCGLLLI